MKRMLLWPLAVALTIGLFALGLPWYWALAPMWALMVTAGVLFAVAWRKLGLAIEDETTDPDADWYYAAPPEHTYQAYTKE